MKTFMTSTKPLIDTTKLQNCLEILSKWIPKVPSYCIAHQSLLSYNYSPNSEMPINMYLSPSDKCHMHQSQMSSRVNIPLLPPQSS